MNRGGLQGAAFELDDRFTGYDVATIAASRIDGGKMLCRIALDDPGTVATLEACAQAVTDLAAHGLMAMVEPFWSHRRRRPGRQRPVDRRGDQVGRRSPRAWAPRSAHTWLKLPVVDEIDG